MGRPDGGAGERPPLRGAGGAHGGRVPWHSGAHPGRGAHPLGRRQLREEVVPGS